LLPNEWVCSRREQIVEIRLPKRPEFEELTFQDGL
jgi:hypothetical protein